MSRRQHGYRLSCQDRDNRDVGMQPQDSTSPAGAGAPGTVAVIVVNYGTAALAIEAVASVLAHRHGGRRVTVHLVDNASPGDDAAMLAAARDTHRWGDRVVLHLERQNHGFGRGNNLVLRRLAQAPAPPGMAMFLNPDARLENEAIDILARALEARPAAVVAGAGIAKPDGTPVTAAFRFPNAVNEFAAALNFGPVARLTRRWQVPLPPGHPAGPVDWVAGAAALARFDALARIGFFDPAFFLYYEEVDLMRRLRQAGGEILYVPAARVTHAEGAATGVASGRPARRRRPAYWYDSWHHYFRKTHGRTGAALAGAGWIAGAALNRVIAPLRRQPPHAPLGFFGDFWSRAGRPLLGLEPRRRG